VGDNGYEPPPDLRRPPTGGIPLDDVNVYDEWLNVPVPPQLPGDPDDPRICGGDSGGPLFDMQGRVIGIHSRIGGQITANMHVPVDTYRDTWEQLVKAEVWGGFGFPNLANVPYLGIEGDPDGKEARITKIVKGAAAEKAGLQVDDVITSFDGKKIERYEDLRPQIMRKKIGDKVAVEVLRGDKTVKLEVVLGKRPD